MTQYTKEDLAAFKEASAELAEIVILTKLVSGVPQNLCDEMDKIFRRVYARRLHRVVNEYMQVGEGEKLDLKKPLTLKDLKWPVHD